jgi:hypothetical protein
VHPPVDEALIFKAEIEQALARRALPVTISDDLPKQAGLASPAHADHRRGLARDGWQPDITTREPRQRRCLRINDLLLNYCAQ